MIQNISEIQNSLKSILLQKVPPLKIRADLSTNFEVAGTIETMQGKQKVEGIFFASIVPKEKDVRLYFFPIYTHPDQFNEMPSELKKCLKGKSCFHIKNLNMNFLSAIDAMVKKGIEIYQKEGWLVS
jgi:hypothetical protein